MSRASERKPREQLPTPALIVDIDSASANIKAMQERVGSLGASLRPHFKSHRSTYLATRQRESGAIGFACATVSQAAAVAGGFQAPSILQTSPVHIDRTTSITLRHLGRSCSLLHAVDCVDSVERLRAVLGSEPEITAVIEIDVGCRRTGAALDDIDAIVRAANRCGLSISGVFGYPGRGYVPTAAREAVRSEVLRLNDAMRRLDRLGVEGTLVSGGCTPTMSFYVAGNGLTEYRPGSYVLGDRLQVALGAIRRSSIAAKVLATVIASHRGYYVVDSGAKAIGRYEARSLTGFGEVMTASPRGDVISELYDHHGVVSQGTSAPPPRVGDRVWVLPNNANYAVSLNGALWLDDGSNSVCREHVASDVLAD